MQRIALSALVTILTACNVQQEVNDDMTILNTVYSNVRVPDGFFKEDTPNDAFYTTSHIRRADVDTDINRAGGNDYELSANTLEDAINMDGAATDNIYGQYPLIIDITETDLYYQVLRAGSNDAMFYRRARVFKSDVLDRNGAVLNCDKCYQGKVNTEWLTLERAKFIIEYLWTFTLDNNNGNSVLSTNIQEFDYGYVYSMTRAELTKDVTGEGCDTVNLFAHTYSINSKTGEINKDTLLYRTIYSQLMGNKPQICEKEMSNVTG